MREARTSAADEGVVVTFPFKPTDVAALHACSYKHGHGVYFRLKDGRVFSALGAELDPNPACYDSGERTPQWRGRPGAPRHPAFFE
jgi:hypothetical protein